MITPCTLEQELRPQVPIADEPTEPLLGNTLMKSLQKQAKCLLETFLKTFTSTPGQTTLVQHVIQTNAREVILDATPPLLCCMRDVV